MYGGYYNAGMAGSKVVNVNVFAISGTSAKMECDLKASIETDQIASVSWSRYNNNTPIYTFDLRSGQFQGNIAGGSGSVGSSGISSNSNSIIPFGTSLSREMRLGDRAYLRVEDTRPLQFQHIIDNVRQEDEGIYKCTVHFMKSPTLTTLVNLTVIVDIRELVIIDWSGRLLKGHTTQPLPEGASANITCIAYGGKPLARVTWWKGGVLVDDTDEVSEEGQLTTNVLRIAKVTRKDLLTTYSCEASNSHNQVPITAQITIEMYLRPLEIRLEGKVDGLSVSMRHDIICRMRGCRPPGKITWWKDGILINNADVKETTI
ncbi:cell adhesion molecule 2-like [Chrysoperla carnea]|uniref:cell adhesion molecule 2-like n=1 Tax=Chrysoperla carnea TaxID=189513 RepID=UPI001D07924E|nr:cell adhesion molecule 2-like [Chrysoperla carnea]